MTEIAQKSTDDKIIGDFDKKGNSRIQRQTLDIYDFQY